MIHVSLVYFGAVVFVYIFILSFNCTQYTYYSFLIGKLKEVKVDLERGIVLMVFAYNCTYEMTKYYYYAMGFTFAMGT